MTNTTRRDDLPALPLAEAARQAMIRHATLAGRGQRSPLASDLRQDAAVPRMLSAEAARDAMIRRSR